MLDLFGIGAGELVLLLIVALVVFGPERLPELGKTLGKAVREFKAATDSVQAEIGKNLDEAEKEEPAAKPEKGTE